MKAKAKPLEAAVHGVFLFCGILSVGLVLLISVNLIISGIPAIAAVGPLKFLLGQKWQSGAGEFGILPNLLNTLYIILVTMLIAVPLDVCTAVYLTEYAKNRKLVRLISFATETLTGILSILFGLVGMLFFLLGELIELDETDRLFTRPKHPKTEEYITGRFG